MDVNVMLDWVSVQRTQIIVMPPKSHSALRIVLLSTLPQVYSGSSPMNVQNPEIVAAPAWMFETI